MKDSLIRRFQPNDGLNELISYLETQGAAIVEDVIPQDFIDAFGADIEPHLTKAREIRNAAEIGITEQTVRIGAVLSKSRRMAALLTLPLLKHVCDHFLLPYCSRYQLCSTQVVEVSPGDKSGKLHRDDVIWPIKGTRPVAIVNCLFSLTDFTEKNGATRVLLGSHLFPRDESKIVPGSAELDSSEERSVDRLSVAEMPRGSVLILLSGVIHGSGENKTSDQLRRALSISFNLGWLRQEENLYLTVPPEIAMTFSAEIQELIGYAVHAPYLGHTDFD